MKIMLKDRKLILIIVAVIILGLLIYGLVYYFNKNKTSPNFVEKSNYIPLEISSISNLNSANTDSQIRKLNTGTQYLTRFPVTDPSSTAATIESDFRNKGFFVSGLVYNKINNTYSLGGINSVTNQHLQLFILSSSKVALSTSTITTPWLGIISLYNGQ